MTNLQENIKNLYKQVDGKTQFIKFVASYFNMKPASVRNHWLSESGFWSVPEKQQAELIKLLQNQIKSQK